MLHPHPRHGADLHLPSARPGAVLSLCQRLIAAVLWLPLAPRSRHRSGTTFRKTGGGTPGPLGTRNGVIKLGWLGKSQINWCLMIFVAGKNQQLMNLPMPCLISKGTVIPLYIWPNIFGFSCPFSWFVWRLWGFLEQVIQKYHGLKSYGASCTYHISCNTWWVMKIYCDLLVISNVSLMGV